MFVLGLKYIPPLVLIRIQYGTERYGTVLNDTVQYGAVRNGTVRQGMYGKYGTVQYSRIRYGKLTGAAHHKSFAKMSNSVSNKGTPMRHFNTFMITGAAKKISLNVTAYKYVLIKNY